ncbi:hypothetical protein FOZ62_012132, partial [Perkinsus olseni]
MSIVDEGADMASRADKRGEGYFISRWGCRLGARMVRVICIADGESTAVFPGQSDSFLPMMVSTPRQLIGGRSCLISLVDVRSLETPWLHLGGRRWFAKPKQRKQKKIIPTAEHLATKGLPPLRLEDRIGNPQSPYEIAKNIRQHVSRLTKQDRNQ